LNKTYLFSKRSASTGRFEKYGVDIPRLLFIFLILFVSACATGGGLKGAQKGELQDIKVDYLNGEEKVVITSTTPILYTAFKLKQPLRLVLDINDTDIGKIEENIKVNQAVLNSIKVSRFQGSDTARLELVLNQETPHEISRLTPNTITVSLKGSGEITPEALAKAISIQDIALVKVPNDKLRVVLKTNGRAPQFSFFKTANSNQLILDLKNSVLLPTVSREVEIPGSSSLINKIRSYQSKNAPIPETRVIISLNNQAHYNAYRDAGNVLVDISLPPKEDQEGKVVADAKDKLDSGKAIAKKAEDEKKPLMPEKQFVGKKMSMDLQKTDITSVLKLISDVSGLNIVISGAVEGTITMHIVDVPWDQALDIILKTAKLGMIRDGNVIRVAPFDVIAAENEGRITQEMASKKLEDLGELFTIIVPVNYAQAADLVKNIDKLKGPRGDISIDERTNSVIVTDTAANMAKIEDLVKKLDKRTPQILIEARIVEVNRNYTNSLGIEWGGTSLIDPTTLKGSVPEKLGILGSAVGTNVVSLPAAVGAGSGGALSATLGNVLGTATLDMRLSALESNGKARILSTPKIVTSDNKEATINSGKSIPYSTVSADGTTIQFIDATISLTVKPHITSDDFISMTIEATKNEADFGNQVQGTPSIIKKSAKTALLIKNGDTTVIGGLYKTSESNATAGVPGLSKIPILGWLFKNRSKTDDGEELLIFITATRIE